MTARRPRRRRVLLSTLCVLVVLVASWGVWAYRVVQHPRVDTAAPVDAVLVLGGLPGSDRTRRALDLARAGLTHTLVISVPGDSPDDLTRRTCARPPAGIEVVCFRPDPSTTRGEARELQRLADARHWTRVAVVTSTYHVSRARMIVQRCYGGTLLMLTSGESISATEWAYEWLYQTAGYVKAEILRGC